MYLFRFLLISITSCFIISCSGDFKDLTDFNKIPKNDFSRYLFNEYKEKAEYEANQMHDWNSAKLYSIKALKSTNGVKIKPEKIEYWKISNTKVKELKIAYDNLMAVYDDAINADPYNLAKAISSLDCWAEQQEENWQIGDINKCKEDFLNSMHNIYNKIKKDFNKNKEKNSDIEKTNKKSITVITKNKEKINQQIIYFDFDKSNLSTISINLIKKYIKNNKDNIEEYLIVGHTDTKGSKKYNIKLSLERAETVKEILINEGILPKKIKILGKGETKLLVETEDEMPHPANRRAEIKPLN